MASLLLWFGISSLLFSGSTSAPTNSSSARCCTLLQLKYGNETFTPNSNGYTKSLSTYWSLQARTNPACIVTPSCADEVSGVVQILSNNSCQFAIRSGGHNPFPDNNIDGTGVTVDLSRLSSINVAQSTVTTDKVAQIGPGARWGQVYDALTPQGLTVGGGRAATVGVGGLVLGGGNSFFAAQYGFVCDNVENFQAVLANGQIVDANAKTNPDLWKVLKGGSNNFAIVTRIDISTIAAPEIWGGIVLYPGSTIPQQISAFVNFTDKIEQDPSASLITFWAYTSMTNMTAVENTYEYTKAVTSPPPPFDELLAIQPEIPNTNTLGLRNLTSLTAELDAAGNLQDLFATLTFANDADIITEIYAMSEKLLQPIKGTKGLNWIVMFQPLPSIISKHSQERGGNILGLDRAKGNQVLFLFFVQWDDASKDDVIQKSASTFMQQITDLTKSKGKDNDWIYLNYALADQDVLGSYGAENIALMQAASKKYDPTGVFQKLVPGGYKIANARPKSQ